MKNFKKVIALVLAAVVCLAAFSACSSNGGTKDSDNYAADNTEYFIGGTGPLTGDVSSYGISVQQGAQIAIDEINAAC